MSLLRKKRFQEEQLNKLDKMLENIEKMTTDLEFTQVEMNVIEGLKAGNVALKKLHEIISVDDVERIMDETRDGIEKQQVSAILFYTFFSRAVKKIFLHHNNCFNFFC